MSKNNLTCDEMMDAIEKYGDETLKLKLSFERETRKVNIMKVEKIYFGLIELKLMGDIP